MDVNSSFKDELISTEDNERYFDGRDAQQLSEEEKRYYLNKLSDLLKVSQADEPYKRKEQLLDYDDQIVGFSRSFFRNVAKREIESQWTKL